MTLSMDLHADVLVIGSGVAGALVAYRTARKGAKVIIMEAGPQVDRVDSVRRFQNAFPKTPESAYAQSEFTPHPETDKPYAFYAQKGSHPFNSTYLRQVGGTTWHWLGSAIRLVPADFRMKSLFSLGVDWPISYADLEPWYCQAEQELEVAGDDRDDLGSPRSAPYPMPPIAQSFLDLAWRNALDESNYKVRPTPQARLSKPSGDRPSCHGSASCIPICPIQAKYDATIHVARAQSFGAMLLNETCANFVECRQDGRVEAVRFVRSDGSTGRVFARIVVVAANGVETPRLLLASICEAFPGGVANRSDQLGRNLMDHPIQLSWALTRQPVWPYRGPGATSGIENFRDLKDRNVNSALRFEIGNEGWSWPKGAPESTARELALGGLRAKALDTALKEQTARHIRVAALTDQLPLASNRVTLDSTQIERTGLPRAAIFYQLDSYTDRALANAKNMHEDMFRRIGVEGFWHKDGAEAAGHIMGTARMGDDPATSVVDKDLRAHGHRNLFLVGAAAFPTGGTANPTLTIAALALRASGAVLSSLTE
ncbi:GMC family oxidoreductase [Methylocystis sp. B8]|uniref:GMC family oxidoreductase n=1 Tax=Methylocystis sp. B8 TaxID=544938 RepID=UPI001FED72FD|nr:GMC family oxidoreductase [Methylocystis sp. B8]